MSKSNKNKKYKRSKTNNTPLGQGTPKSFSHQNSFKNVKIFVPKNQNSSTAGESIQNIDQLDGNSQLSSPKISQEISLSQTPTRNKNLLQETHGDEKSSSTPITLETPRTIEKEIENQKDNQVIIHSSVEKELKENSFKEQGTDQPKIIEGKEENFVEEIKAEFLAKEIEVIQQKVNQEEIKKKSLPQQSIIVEEVQNDRNDQKEVINEERSSLLKIPSFQRISNENLDSEVKEIKLFSRNDLSKGEEVPKSKGRDDCCAKCNIF